ncbi:glycosyltransferase [Rhodoligotrophos defluvii]|uniref:glycosyltransferase n=1 Tax=Rhodoligotrophos defluvii TaxID=2561934 RepID=UPI0010C98558|nr:glycosyltransferase [Rhodoligotrophos defluvii]
MSAGRTDGQLDETPRAELAKVLHCITDLDIGGAEQMLAQFLALNTPASAQMPVLSLMLPGPLSETIGRLGIAIHSLRIPRGRVQVHRVPELVRIIRSTRPNLIHGWMYHANVAASIGAMLAAPAMPVIWSIHHTLYDPKYEKPLTQRVIRLSAALSRRAAAIVYCSRLAATQHQRIGFENKRSIVIHNGIDCDLFRPDGFAKARLARRLGISAERVIVGSVSRYHPMKSPQDLVLALAELLADGHDVHGVFIGPGHSEGPVSQVARELGIHDRITVWEAERSVREIMPGLDVHVISSTWGESFSLATAEAMACGVPAVVTDLGDCAFLVGETGQVAIPGQPGSLAAALAPLIKMSKHERRALGLRARQRVIERFSIAQFLNKYAELYECVTA